MHISKASKEIKKSSEASHSELKYLLAEIKHLISENKVTHKNINWNSINTAFRPPKMRVEEDE